MEEGIILSPMGLESERTARSIENNKKARQKREVIKYGKDDFKPKDYWLGNAPIFYKPTKAEIEQHFKNNHILLGEL